MIEIKTAYIYEPEACDCCRGYYDLYYEVYIDGEFKERYREASDVLPIIAAHSTEVVFVESEYPDD